jgi:hypothetical protein
MAVNFTFIRQSSDASGTSVTFSENNAGSLLVSMVLATAILGDFTAAPATLTDSANNVWNLMYSEINGGPGGVSTLFNAIFVYAVSRCVSAVGNELDLSSLFPGDVQASQCFGVELQSNFSNVTFVASSYEASETTNDFFFGSIGLDNTKLLLACTLDSSGTVASPNLSTGFELTAAGPSAAFSAAGFEAITEANNVPTTIESLSTGGTPDTFGVAMTMQGTNGAVGGNPAQQLTFSINKGPRPVPPEEGRAICTVQVDCTQQAVSTLDLNFPEYAYFLSDAANADNNIAGFTLLEFDLEHLFQGSGLSEVRTLIAWSRPNFNYDGTNRQDTQYASDVYPAFITNKTTLQTICLGEAVVNQGTVAAQYVIMPFPANKNALKYRFICPQVDASTPAGKFTLCFLNFDCMGAYSSVAALMAQAGVIP